MSKRLEFFLVFLDNGEKGFYLIHNNELSPRPNLKKVDLSDYDLLYTVGTQIWKLIKERSGSRKIWSRTSASPKEFIKHLDMYTPICFIEDKKMHIQIYASSKDNLKEVCMHMTRYSHRTWYKGLCQRLGITLILSSLLFTGCTLKTTPQEPLILDDTVDDLDESFDMKEYIIQNFIHDVPYLAPVDGVSENIVALQYKDEKIYKLVYGIKSEGLTSIQAIYNEEAEQALQTLLKEDKNETNT